MVVNTRPGAMRRMLLVLAAILTASPALATEVTIQTSLGDFQVELFDEAAPVTVNNFLNYVRGGDYTGSFIHRSVPGFVIQGGGFTFADGAPVAIPTDPPITNEPGISNLRGTIAMAKQAGNPDSATSQWFINLGDNSGELDDQNGGFTVFGKVLGDGMQVVDAIAALQIWNAGAPFDELPLIDFPGGNATIDEEHLVFVDVQEDAEFSINAGLNDAWFNPATSGQGFFITVFPDLGQVFLAWFTYDVTRPGTGAEAQLGEPGHRWLTAFGPFSGNRAELDVEITSGGVFDTSDPVPAQEADGTVVLEFTDCETGTIEYDLPSIDRQGVIPIERLALDNVPFCESLTAP
ncbi:peptidylprolyl isomerase [Elongatibacter sediminis]|uniref:peptidylprolyl isomerase n=1 Tax=Elongatibacter sediminis TaxID=3119006 RepID=A0AAW9REQ0_9GAMM